MEDLINYIMYLLTCCVKKTNTRYNMRIYYDSPPPYKRKNYNPRGLPYRKNYNPRDLQHIKI